MPSGTSTEPAAGSPQLTAHQLSTGSAIALFAGYFEWLARRYPLASTREALEVGTAWLALTVAFEFGFVRGVAHTSMGRAARRLRPGKGRLWPLVPAWIVLGPAVVRARRAVVRVECLSERSD